MGQVAATASEHAQAIAESLLNMVEYLPGATSGLSPFESVFRGQYILRTRLRDTLDELNVVGIAQREPQLSPLFCLGEELSLLECCAQRHRAHPPGDD